MFLGTVFRISLVSLLYLATSIAIAGETGGQLYQKFSACHSFGYNRTGPDHCGVVGRLAGALSGFEYTEAMRSSKIVWTAESLDLFLKSPLGFVPGTSMGFAGIASEQDRRAIINFIKNQNDSINCD